MFLEFLVFFSLLLIHELGHSIVGTYLGFTLEKIEFYPFGGISKFDSLLNRPIKDELIMLISGPLAQCLFYYSIIGFTSSHVSDLFRLYHYNILFFNLLPICILDGGKLLQLFCCYVCSYWKSLQWIYVFSYLTCLIFLLISSINRQLQFIFLGSFILSKITLEYRKRKYYYQKFLLERYLYSFPFSKRKVIDHAQEMKRDYLHLFRTFSGYKTEKEMLAKKFRKNY